MKWLKYVLIVLGLLLAGAVALPFFISLDDYIPQIEQEVSARFKESVSIKSIRFTSLPLPHVTVDGITIGRVDDIRLGKVRVTPDLFSLLQSTKVIKSIEIDTLTMTQQALGRIPVWSNSGDAKSPRFRVESIRVDSARVYFGKASVGPFVAEISIDSKGDPVLASMATQDGKLKMFIKPDQSKYLIDANAQAWTLPVGPSLIFDELSIKGVATLDDANLTQVNARLYGGTAQGKATVSWREGVKLAGNIDIHQVEMRKISSLLSPKVHVSGRLNANPVFSASAASVNGLIHALHLETPFRVQNGVLYGVDFQKVAAGLFERGASGGKTHFDRMSGHLGMEHGGYRFTQLKIASGTLAVDGNVDVSPRRELSGRVGVQVRAVGASTKIPLNVSGTVDAPLLRPTTGTMAGAAVGTVMMGPGLGISVGARIGGWVERLFGMKEEKKHEK